MAQFLTAAELATVLRRSLWTIYRDAKSGRIPAHRVNGRGKMLFDPDEVRKALTGHSASATAPTA